LSASGGWVFSARAGRDFKRLDRPVKRLIIAALAVEPEDVVHPGLLGGWGCLATQYQVLFSAEQAKKTAGHLEGKQSDLYQQEAERFAGTRKTAEEVFGRPILDEDGWHKIHGQHLPGLEDCVAWMYRFLGQPLTEAAATGIYDFLSNLSHPTLYPHAQMWEKRDMPGISLDDHERRAAAAVAPFYNVLSMAISYNDWSTKHHDDLTEILDRLMPGILKS